MIDTLIGEKYFQGDKDFSMEAARKLKLIGEKAKLLLEAKKKELVDRRCSIYDHFGPNDPRGPRNADERRSWQQEIIGRRRYVQNQIDRIKYVLAEINVKKRNASAKMKKADAKVKNK